MTRKKLESQIIYRAIFEIIRNPNINNLFFKIFFLQSFEIFQYFNEKFTIHVNAILFLRLSGLHCPTFLPKLLSLCSVDIINHICTLLALKIFVDPQTDRIFHHKYLTYPVPSGLLTSYNDVKLYLLQHASL